MTAAVALRPLSAALLRPRAALWAAGAVWLVSLAAYLNGLTNSDVAWYLVATAKWLDGARLYRDIIEINPPLIYLLNVVPVIAGRLTGLSAESAMVVYVHLLIALSLWLSFRILSVQEAAVRSRRHVILCVLVTGLCGFAVYDLGEREHFLVVLSLPYVLAAISRAAGNRLPTSVAVAAGLLAALGYGLKPHFLLVPVLLEAYLMLRHRSLRTVLQAEPVSLAGAVLAYGVGVLWFAPDYLTRIVPWALLVYDTYNHPMALVFLSWQTLIIPGLIAAHLANRRTRARPEIADVMLITAAAFFLIYLVQHKAWTYHIVPAETFAFFALSAMAALDPLLAGDGRSRRTVIGWVAVAAMLAIPVVRGPFRLETARVLLPAVERHAAGGAVFTFSSYLWVSFPLVNLAKVPWSSRFPSLWLLPGAWQGLRAPGAARDAARASRLEGLLRYTVDAVVEDFARTPPRLVIVDRRADPRFGGTAFDYPAYFGEDPRFAEIWAGYRKVARVQRGKVGPFDLYVRRLAAGTAAE